MKRKIETTDLLPMDVYSTERKRLRSQVVAKKRNRRVEVGPFATFYFENFDTMLSQVHEMLFIERGGEEQVADELAAYNPLIPQGSELVATFMIEIDDPERRAAMLAKLTHIERTIAIEIDGEKIMAVPEEEVERTKDDGKTSSIHFLHFPFTPAQVAAFRDPAKRVMVSINHQLYGHLAVLGDEVRKELSGDFA